MVLAGRSGFTPVRRRRARLRRSGTPWQISGFISDILRQQQHLAIPLNVMRHSGTTQLNHALGLLAASGASMNLEYLYAHRAVARDSVESFTEAEDPARGSDVRLSGQLPRLQLPPDFERPVGPA